ncbi:glutathione s transferase d10 isoform a-related [Holotrichia oblita]|uniref:Glutathione s transferase d10 isoform a-related n=1 Tax=Holotrichia oblita TaxID=644536 RepID=A0ACB9T022_HOLOL|nr:glutathione s transferase d10 isoform a-related [Holotrichia oblita]
MQNDTVIPIFTADKSAANKSEKMNGGEDDEEATIDFYYFPPSPPCRSVLLLARTLGIEFNLKLVNILEGEQMSPEYVKRPIVFQHQPPDPESAEKVEEALGYLNAFLDNHPWVAGPYMTVADFAVVATVATAKAGFF